MKQIFGILLLGCALGAPFPARGSNGFTTLDYPNATSTQAWGLNPRGDIIGFYLAADNNDHGFLYNGGHYTAINYPGAAVTLVNGVNCQDNMVGEFGVTAASLHRGFQLSAEGVFTPIDFPGAVYTSAIGINARGDMAGIYNFSDNVSHGFLLAAGIFTQIDYPGASATIINGISPQGDIVGGYSLGGVSHAFQLSNGAFTSIDYPNAAFTTATGQNAAGDIVGRYRDAAGVNHGFLLSNGQFTTIDFPSATYTGATAIDNAGNVTGRCTVSGSTHGFLLASSKPPLRYTIRDLGVVGNAPAQPFVIKENRLVSGGAAAPDGTVQAVVWANGAMTGLGSAGLNSVAFGINAGAIAVGGAEIQSPDPTGEDFCGFQALGVPSAGNTCRPFTSQYGVKTLLPTLGGANGVAEFINARGQVAGIAENTVLDPSCPSPQKYQFKPVLWQGGEAFELPTVKGDLNGVALAINENGQIAGASGACSTFSPTVLTNLQPLHALLWETGGVTDLGNLGGTGNGSGIVALGLNNTGQVVGSSDSSGRPGLPPLRVEQACWHGGSRRARWRCVRRGHCN